MDLIDSCLAQSSNVGTALVAIGALNAASILLSKIAAATAGKSGVVGILHTGIVFVQQALNFIIAKAHPVAPKG